MDRIITALKTSFELSHAILGVFQLSLLMTFTVFLVVTIFLASKLYNASSMIKSKASTHIHAMHSTRYNQTQLL